MKLTLQPPIFPRTTNWVFKLLIGFSLLVFCQTGNADENNASPADSPVKIEVELSDTTTHVAESFELEITITALKNITIHLPPLEDHLGPFEIIGHRDINDIPFHDNRRWQRKIQLESLKAGEFEIPAMEIGYVDRRNRTLNNGIASTESQLVSVISNFETPTSSHQFRDINSVVFIPENDTQFAHLPTASTLAASLMLALGFAAVIFVKRKKRITPRKQILIQLHDLQTQVTKELISNEDALVSLSKVARYFSKIEYQISAPELTTNEFLSRASTDPRLTFELQQLLFDLLNQADMIKFAGALKAGTDIKQTIGQLISIVKQTNNPTQEFVRTPGQESLRALSQSPSMEEN